jgi:hypothetical protein
MSETSDLIWDGELPDISAAIAKEIPMLREKNMVYRVIYLKQMLTVPKNMNIALAIISDDPSKLTLVHHVSTDKLHSLACLNMIRARHEYS